MTVTLDWEPELPPVPISMGMKADRAIWADRASSKAVIISPVKVADTIISISQGIRFLNRSTGELLRYGFSEGVIPLISSISSVASSSMTSMASSKVTMPTIRFSPSTTGRARKLYLLNIRATCSWSVWVVTEIRLVIIRSSIFRSSSSASSRSFTVTRPIRVRSLAVT